MSMMSPDQRRLRALYDAHGQQVYARAMRMLGRPSDAEEVVQEVFVRALLHIDELRQGHVIRWLYRTTTNYCLNLMRDRNRRQGLLEARGTSSEVDHSSPDAMLTLRALLSRADEREAQAVAYVYLSQLTQPQAAELMGVSARTVRTLIASFREWAATQLGEEVL